ncbi:unnamed protein product [Urochloa humidicola]
MSNKFHIFSNSRLTRAPRRPIPPPSRRFLLHYWPPTLYKSHQIKDFTTPLEFSDPGSRRSRSLWVFIGSRRNRSV